MSDKNIIPIFYDDSSLKAINVWWEEKDAEEGGPPLIIKMAKEAKLSEVYFVSTNFYSFRDACKRCEENNIKLIFGLQLLVTENSKDQSDNSSKGESKIIIWLKNSQAYYDIIKLYSAIYTDINNKYYHYRTDWKTIKQYWTDNFILSLPFFDSVIHNNLLKSGPTVVCDFPCKPLILKEINSGLPFANLLEIEVEKYIAENNLEKIETKTIYYEKYIDFSAYLVYKAVDAKTVWSKPEMEFMCSNRFCFEDWKELVK